MKMKFTIRDDDVNFFTNFNDLQRIYQCVWTRIPISFAVIPFRHPSCVISDIPKVAKKQSNQPYPVGNNEMLINGLREKICNGYAAVMLHGYSHAQFHGRAEFETGNETEAFVKIQHGKRYLEKIFGVTVKTFVPPQSALSRAGSKAVIRNHLNILLDVGHYVWERPFTLKNITGFSKLVTFYLLHGKKKRRYPYPVDFGTHREFGCYSLDRKVTLQELLNGLYFSLHAGGSFCIEVHHHYFLNDSMLLDLFYKFINIVNTYQDCIEFVSVDELFEIDN